MSVLHFPKEFHFGSAISAYQAEGYGGLRRSDWDDYLVRRQYEILRPGEVGPSWWKPNVAEGDLSLMAKLNLGMQRIGIEWARIEPEEGVINYEAIARYRQILTHMKAVGLAPMVTLSHYVLPRWISDLGGWKSEKTISYFLRFIHTVLKEFPEVNYWIIMNEPSILLKAGYVMGYFPPFDRNVVSYLSARKTLMKAMREGYGQIKSLAPHAQVGNAYSFAWMRPHAHDSWLELFLTATTNYVLNTNYVDATRDACDFIGINFYTGYYVEFHPAKVGFSIQKDASVLRASLPLSIAIRPSAYRSDWGWPIVPDFLLHLLVTLKKRYNKPLFITENGIADREDTYRAFYLLVHLVAIWRARELGADVRGYLHWASVDNLEWNEGFQKRFGLVRVNHFTGEREVRKSAKLLAQVAKSKSITIEECITKFVPSAQQEAARRIIDQLLYDPRGHHTRCTYR